jgi:hypothetical protein
MASELEMRLSDTKLEVAAGESIEVTIRVRNQSQIVDHFSIKVDGIEPDWWKLSAAEVALFPGDEDTVKLTIHPPKEAEAKAGTYQFQVKAISRANPEIITVEEAYLIVRGFTVWEVDMSPTKVMGKSGTYRLTVRNAGNTDISIVFEGKDPEEGLNYSFARDKITIPPGGSGQNQVTVRPRKKVPEKQYIFQILARPDKATVTTKEVKALSGQFEYPRRRKFPWPILLVPLLLIAAFLVWKFVLPKPTITVVDPNGQESWYASSVQTLSWTTTKPKRISSVDLDYSVDEGSNWTSIVTGEDNDGTYEWTLPVADSETCLVRATIRNDEGDVLYQDISDSVFTITPKPTVTITAPNGNELWIAGSKYNITWSTTKPDKVATVDLDYSTDNGSTWVQIAKIEDAGGSYEWEIPNVESENCLVKATIRDSAGEVFNEDRSDKSFTMTPQPTVKVITPNGGESLRINYVHTVKWSTTGLGISTVDLEYSTAMLIYPKMPWKSISKGEANDGSYNWKVPSDESTTCRLRITVRSATGDLLAQDTNDAAFSIIPALPPPGKLTGTIPPSVVLVLKPDLVIEDMWRSGNTWFYRIKNQGNAVAAASTSQLIINGNPKADDSIGTLASGETRVESFTYFYPCLFGSHTMLVRADKDNVVVESDEGNNTRSEPFVCP